MLHAVAIVGVANYDCNSDREGCGATDIGVYNCVSMSNYKLVAMAMATTTATAYVMDMTAAAVVSVTVSVAAALSSGRGNHSNVDCDGK